MPRARNLPMVGWYSPRQLIRTLGEVLTSRAMMRLLDPRIIERRRLEAHAKALAQIVCETDAKGDEEGGCPYIAEDRRNEKEVWIDYLADTGDGWNSTFMVARTLAQKSLTLKDAALREHRLPRAQIMVLGGDLVYPTPRDDNYEKRLLAPFEQALEKTEPPHPTVLAIPGNHDWYDGLSAFTRIFCYPGSPFAGWVTRQTRSYFAVPLPGNWWLLGVDSQLGDELDRPQMKYFEHVKEHMPADARVILCMPSPDWLEPTAELTDARKKPSMKIEMILGRAPDFQALQQIGSPESRRAAAAPESPAIYSQLVTHRPDLELEPLRAPLPEFPTVDQAGAYPAPIDQAGRRRAVQRSVEGILGRPVEVCLAGDLHHYQRHETIPRHPGEEPHVRITAGGGGGFLHSTHAPLDRRLREGLQRKTSFPSASESRRYRNRLLAFPIRNPTFGLLTALLYVLVTLTVLDSDSRIGSADRFLEIYLRLGSGAGKPWGSLVVLAGASALILGFHQWRSKLSLLIAAGHLAAQLAAMALASALAVNLALWWVPKAYWPRLGVAIALTALGGYLLGAALIGVYLWVSVLCGRLLHPAYAALRIDDWKCFLRLHVSKDGTLRIFPIGFQRIARSWARRTGEDGESRLEPDDPRVTPPELVEMPIVIGPRKADPSTAPAPPAPPA